ncbi:hypothetical protein POM88_036383 [Heracleum sosnowskyi]|uniref:Polygalacturonase n=1 Tax=Heracleum sosnowskyi TaxID=360622 RepID=A0AAD8ME86_9APIA|nr:hypothetical protein POM88_036383 [Heracleum sosnowskyi]
MLYLDCITVVFATDTSKGYLCDVHLRIGNKLIDGPWIFLLHTAAHGQVGDGISYDTQAFANAWKQVYSTPRYVLLVPKGGRYLVNATRFKGSCADKLIIQVICNTLFLMSSVFNVVKQCEAEEMVF